MARRGHHTLAQIKDMIVIAAEELVEEGGLNQLRVRNIATKIGYTVGSIYMVFNSMDELILHLKGRTLDRIIQDMNQVSAPNAEQRLEALAQIYINFARINLNRWSMLFEHRLPDNMTIPDWYHHKLNLLHKKFEDQFESLVQDLSPAEKSHTGLAFLGGIHGICVLMLTQQLACFNENGLENSVNLLVRRFIQEGVNTALAQRHQPEIGLKAVAF